MEFDPRQAAVSAAAIKAAMESGDGEVEVTAPDGTPMRIIKSPEPGVKARIEIAAGDSGSVVTTLWEPGEERPVGYPDGLPFIPNAGGSTSTITEEGRPRTQVQWFGIEDPDAAVERLVAESLADGWEHSRVQPSTPELTRMISLERGGEERTIVVVAAPGFGMITLLDSQPKSSA